MEYLVDHKNLLSDLESIFVSSIKDDIFENIMLWSSHFTEKNLFKSSTVLNYLRMLVLQDLIKSKDYKKIIFRGYSKSISKGIKYFARLNNLQFFHDQIKFYEKKSTLRKIWNIIPNPFKSIIFLIRYIYNNYTFNNKNITNWFSSNNSIFFFSYFTHFKNVKNKSNYTSTQWGPLSELLGKKYKAKLNWLYLFLPSTSTPSKQIGNKIINNINSMSKYENHLFLQDYLTFRLVFRIIRKWIGIQIKYFKARNKFKYYFAEKKNRWKWFIIKDEWNDSMTGAGLMQNLIFFHLFNKFMQSLPKQKIGFYLMENLSWERSFIRLWRKYGHGDLIGVQSASIRFWDLRYFDAKLYNFKNYSRPDKIAINGPEAWSILKNTGYDMKNCVPVEALRYLHLNNNITFLEKKVKTRKVIIMGDAVKYTTNQMLYNINKAFINSDQNFEFWFKPHPNNNIDLSIFRNLTINLYKGSIEDVIKNFNIGICSVYTSSALDLYCSGIHVIGYLDTFNVNFSPLKNILHQQFFNNGRQLKKILNNLNLTSKNKSQAEDFFWLNKDLKFWQKLIDSKQ